MTSLQPLADTSELCRLPCGRASGCRRHDRERPRHLIREMSRDLARVTTAVRELGIERGGRVAIGCEGTYVHWLLLAACERLGIATASYGKDESAAAAALLSGVDLALAEPSFGTVGARRSHVIAPQWIVQVLARSGAEPIAPAGAPEDSRASYGPPVPLGLPSDTGLRGIHLRSGSSRQAVSHPAKPQWQDLAERVEGGGRRSLGSNGA
jgi:hypothetical protein